MTQHYCAACHHPMLDNDFRHICQSVLEDRVRQLEAKVVGMRFAYDQTSQQAHDSGLHVLELEKALAESIAQTERWTVQANQYAVALDESRGHVIHVYRCPHCGRVAERDSTKAWIKSFCELTGKYVRLQRVKVGSV